MVRAMVAITVIIIIIDIIIIIILLIIITIIIMPHVLPSLMVRSIDSWVNLKHLLSILWHDFQENQGGRMLNLG